MSGEPQLPDFMLPSAVEYLLAVSSRSATAVCDSSPSALLSSSSSSSSRNLPRSIPSEETSSGKTLFRKAYRDSRRVMEALRVIDRRLAFIPAVSRTSRL